MTQPEQHITRDTWSVRIIGLTRSSTSALSCNFRSGRLLFRVCHPRPETLNNARLLSNICGAGKDQFFEMSGTIIDAATLRENEISREPLTKKPYHAFLPLHRSYFLVTRPPNRTFLT
jgi:hypothetical protein